ncbi:MAG: MBL fold metallo-hydrolase, partial [Burkholderiaceae bacterium]|nr:MBL fold metallo-hydrolase [Burkholderiaceae bacterium]
MNPLENQLDYPLGDMLPDPATTIEVAPGIRWVRMPLPFALDHINLWLLRDDFDGEGWTLIDCGISSAEIRGLWERLFADGLDGLPIRRILCTHTHPDHVGLAHWIHQRFGAPLWMTMGEYALGRVFSAMLPGADGDSDASHFRRHGVPPGALLEAIRARGKHYFSSLVPAMPLSFRRIREGELVRIGGRDWRVVIGIGHSPEHASLYCEADALLISGDMVLPRISTNVSVFETEPESNPVDWFIASLRKFVPCREDTLVLPSHGKPFRGLHTRIGQLVDHHDERLALVIAACRARAPSAYEVTPILFPRPLDTHQSTFAIGESLAHLHALWYRGRVT